MIYIAGVGHAPFSKGSSSTVAEISAATKALLEAGISYDDVDQGVSSIKGENAKSSSKAFKAFDARGGVEVHNVESGKELQKCLDLITNQDSECVLLVATVESSALAAVITSDKFLWRHPYLKDSAAKICKSSSSGQRATAESSGELDSLCQRVWALKGWTKEQSGNSSVQGFDVSRADSKKAAKWADIEHKQDGRDRLGYNPAAETRGISQEDFNAVKAIHEGGNDENKSVKLKRRGGDRAALAKL